MTAAATALPRSPIVGIASCLVGTEIREFEIGWDELERDIDWAETQLRSAGLDAGDMVLSTISQWEGPWTTPVVRALHRIGVVILCAEVWSFDAKRTSMFLQRLPVKAMFGLGGETLTALQAEEPPIAELFRNVELVWARPDAVSQLEGMEGLAPHVLPFVMLGPALALGIPGQPGAMVNIAEWAIESENGELVVSNACKRAATFDRVPTGVRGSVTDSAVTLELERSAE
jgi:hypothetical protein